MSQPGVQEGIFMSPYSDQGRVDPETEVFHIVQKVTASFHLNPVVETFFQDPVQKELFLEVFARQANLIKSRCQAFDDCHVTVYDKALLALTENGNKFDAGPAQEYFCEEFLGISKNGIREEANRILDQSVVLKAIVARAAYPRGKYGEKYSSETVYSGRGQERAPSGSAVSAKQDETDIKVARLTSIYEKAKSDFESIAAGDHEAKLEAVRFLRDTAENTVMYFRNTKADGSNISPELMADLELTCKSSQASVVTLSGGRKRKFDQHDYTVPSVTPRGSAHRRRPGGRSAAQWPAPRRDPRPSADGRSSRAHQSRGSSSSGGDHRRGEDRHAFGYNRPVDSYQPAAADGGGASHSHPHQQTPYHHQASGSAAGAGLRPHGSHDFEPRDRDHGHGHDYPHGPGHGHGHGHGYGDRRRGEYERGAGPYRPSSSAAASYHRTRGY